MKVISLIQPWATLIVIGAKRIETRSWKTPFRGEVLIHASKKQDSFGRNLSTTSPFGKYIKDYDSLPFGAIIGKATIDNITTTQQMKTLGIMSSILLTSEELAFGDYTDGRFAWLLRDVILFEKPTPAKGSLGLWEFPEEQLLSQ